MPAIPDEIMRWRFRWRQMTMEPFLRGRYLGIQSAVSGNLSDLGLRVHRQLAGFLPPGQSCIGDAEHFAKLKDPRRAHRRLHLLQDIKVGPFSRRAVPLDG